MRIKVILFLVVLLTGIALFSCSEEPGDLRNKIVSLGGNWTFCMEGDEQSYSAKVPGTVHTDLLSNNKIPQPFYRDNEKQCQWIDKKNWIYTNEFNIDSTDLKYNKVYINFKGLDTYAEVYLNNHKILYADNMFRSWKADVTGKLLEGENKLTVRFISPVTVGLNALNKLGYPLPAVNDQSEVGGLDNNKISVFTRKAPYHYGWDWGPRFVTMGIWRPVELQFIDKAQITDVYFLQKSVSERRADIQVNVSLKGFEKGNYKITVSNSLTKEKYASSSLNLYSDDTLVKLDFSVQNPDLWWPNGYGKPSLYQFKTELWKDNDMADERENTIGIREIKVVTQPDSMGKSFFFRVNGVPVFAKGANYIPNDNFLTRVSDQKYETIVRSASDANMNMLRVWGGGIYENDIFYNLCDQYGILLWHDFMFACSMYPGDQSFIENVQQEVIENVIRLRNHPSIALWCGNNEIDQAWCNNRENCGWKWKEQYTAEQQKSIWKAYDTLFHTIIPSAIRIYDETRFYWPSSPMADSGVPASYDNTSGDMHYWGVWHGSQPFESFEKVNARFMSEYGFQSFPEMNSISDFTLPQDLDIYSDVMLKHQRSPVGNQKIREYMELYYPVPKDFNGFVYVGQILQAYGIKKAIDFHRIKKSYCMGTLFWQLNDCWPGASWSSIDYYTNWKAIQYKARDAYEPLRLAFLQKENGIDAFVLNDRQEINKGILNIMIIDFEGKRLYSSNKSIQFSFDNATRVFHLDLNENIPGLPVESSLIKAELWVDNKKVDSELHYFVKPKDLNLPETSLKYNLQAKADFYTLDLQATTLEKDVAFYIPGINAVYSDNYFDMLPGERKVIKIIPKTTVNNLLEKGIIIQTLNSIMKPVNITMQK